MKPDLVAATLAVAALLMLGVAASARAAESGLVARITDAPPDGLVIAEIAAGLLPPGSGAITARTVPGGREVPAQLVPGAGAAGPATLVIRLPRGGSATLALEARRGEGEEAITERRVPTQFGHLVFAAGSDRGQPAALEVTGGPTFREYAWNDRVWDQSIGGFSLRYDREARLSVVSRGPVCTVVRVRARYCGPDGKPAPGAPSATYDWYVFPDRPAVMVRASVRQEGRRAWPEWHFLELNFAGADIDRFIGGNPVREIQLKAQERSDTLPDWGVMAGGPWAVGLLTGPVRAYDGRGAYGTYVHGSWHTWDSELLADSAWLWLGPADAPAITRAAASAASAARVVVSTPAVRKAIDTARKAATGLKGAARAARLWDAGLAEGAEARGDLAAARGLAAGKTPTGWRKAMAGSLGLAVSRQDGITVRSLFDTATRRELLAGVQPPLFEISLRRDGSAAPELLYADRGWARADARLAGGQITCSWTQHRDPRFRGVTVNAQATPSGSGWLWSLRVRTTGTPWGVWRAVFPQVALADPGPGSRLLVPIGPGMAEPDPWRRAYQFRGDYANGWAAVQMMAAYGPASRPSGLYTAMHDPDGSTKTLEARSEPAARSVRLAYDHPAPNMGKPGTGFVLPGRAAWMALHGDWYDAARIYRAWASRNARWWPKLGPGGRDDTPLWLRELAVWATAGGSSTECVGPLTEFARRLGRPVGYHWYNWHVNPFDNDYPHYFPARDGFPEGVRALQEAGVRVMPYINGRLWDTRDRGLEDWRFTSEALPAATKREDGAPFVESYGSKETDGSDVKLAVMCPVTELWQRTVRETVLRLHRECGVDGVYIDQIAAASPALCMDPTHGHPLGGGAWWNEGYWKLLSLLRARMAPGKMITTECNAEPYIRWMDGYLTWHWQGQHLVPLFPAIYGGAVQMFGRSYGGGPTRDTAFKVKAGQQLVFGEQIGWMSPSLMDDAGNLSLMRQVVRLRRDLSRFFYAGEMARPPRAAGPMPTVRADWQWGGEMWVDAPALMTGGWRLRAERRVALLFVNVSEQAIDTTIGVDRASWGVPPGGARREVVTGDGEKRTDRVAGQARLPLRVPAGKAVAWVLSW